VSRPGVPINRKLKYRAVTTHVGPKLSLRRKFLYSGLTVAAVALVIEGLAQVVWWRLERSALELHAGMGQQLLKNDAINFMKVADGNYGYRLKPNFHTAGLHINSEGFHQTNEVPVKRSPESFRVICLGESTTFGTSDSSNYPIFLEEILRRQSRNYKRYEIINAGVPGWVSDQVTLRVQHQLANFNPDAVIMYVGWNDFQSYPPMAPPPANTIFEVMYGRDAWKQYAADNFKTVALASGWYDRWRRSHAPVQTPVRTANTPELRFRFLFKNLDDIVHRFQAANPKAKIFVCTLVGLWPQGTLQNWGSVPAWIKNEQVTPADAARFVAELNDQLRLFARTRELSLIDMAAVFADLDRTRLQFDFAHMDPDGYELMAWTMFSALRDAGLVKGEIDARYRQLLTMYKLTVAAGAAASH
jgi:lysophospholipase L1-like esterase